MSYFKVLKLKDILKLICFVSILTLLLTLSKQNFSSVKTSVELFLASVLPSLFPFIFFTEFVLNTDIISILSKYIGGVLSKIFHVSKNSTPAIIIGFLCGFPMGSKTVGNLYAKKLISKQDATILLSFVNNCNPAFILSTVGIGIFYNIKVGVILLIAHYISAILVGIISSIKYSKLIIHDEDDFLNSFNKKDKQNNKIDTKKFTFFENIKKSILNSFVTLGSILGFIVIFNLLFSTLNILLTKFEVTPVVSSFISGIFEVTKGCNLIYNVDFNITFKICIISFVLGFSGLCILCQVYSTISEYKFSFSKIVKAKLLQGIFSFGITYILIRFTNILDISTLNVFNSIDNITYSNYLNNIKTNYLNSTLFVILGLTIYMVYISLKNNDKKK